MGSDLSFKETELRLGLPGTDVISSVKGKKRASPEDDDFGVSSGTGRELAPAPKAQIVGWPPVRSNRKNYLPGKKSEVYVKVSMDGAPYLRKIDLKVYGGYSELLKALEAMFKLSIGDYSEREGYRGAEYAPAYEDKDGDLMLFGDVPWEMFTSSCKRLRIMKGSDAIGLGCGV